MPESAKLMAPRIASPCTVPWDSMQGDSRARHCEECGLRVFNLSEMSSEEAAEFIESAEGRTCVYFYRRADGTLLTRDCPVGLRAVRRRVAALFAGAAALLGFITLGLFSARANGGTNAASGPVERLELTTDPILVQPYWGEMCVPAPPLPPALPANPPAGGDVNPEPEV